MKPAYCLLLFACLITGCAARIHYVPVKQIEVVTQTLRDTTINYVLLPYRDSVNTPDTSSYLRNPYAESWAVWSGGYLSHSLNTLPDTIPITLQIVDIFHTVTIEKPVEVERELTRWQQFKMDVGGWAIGAISTLMAYVIIRLTRKNVSS